MTPRQPDLPARRLWRRWRVTLAIAVVVLAVAIGGLVTLSSVSQQVVLEGSGSSLMGAAGPGVDTSGSVGSVTNNSPWTVRLTGAGTADGDFTSDVRVGISRITPDLAEASDIEWFTDKPVVLGSGETGYLWYLATPTATDPAGFSSLAIRYSDELGREHSVAASIGLLVVPAGLPNGIGSSNGEIDGYSYSSFMSALLEALDTGDPSMVAPFLGGTASPKQAEAFLASQGGLVGIGGYMSETTGAHSATVTLFETNSAEDSRPPVVVSWAHNRWSARLA